MLPFGFIIQLPASIKGLKEGEDRLYTTRRHGTRKRDQATFRLVTLRGRDFHGKIKLFIFATNTVFKPLRIRRVFRKRWGIETSYRMIRKFLAKTTSKCYRTRLLYFYLAVVLYNLWVKLNFRQDAALSADILRLHLAVFLVISFLPDLEKPIIVFFKIC
jgi:IS4 transposase